MKTAVYLMIKKTDKIIVRTLKLFLAAFIIACLTEIMVEAGTKKKILSELKTGNFSAYTSDPAETDSTPFITADGTNLLKNNSPIVANNDHPFGTRIYIHGFGVYEVRDRMNRRYTGTNSFDIYFGRDKQKALEFGRRKLKYRIVDRYISKK